MDDDEIRAGLPCTVVEYVDRAFQGASCTVIREVIAERPATIDKVIDLPDTKQLIVALEGHAHANGEARLLRLFERRRDAWVCTSHEHIGRAMMLVVGHRRLYNDEAALEPVVQSVDVDEMLDPRR